MALVASYLPGGILFIIHVPLGPTLATAAKQLLGHRFNPLTHCLPAFYPCTDINIPT